VQVPALRGINSFVRKPIIANAGCPAAWLFRKKGNSRKKKLASK